MKNLYNLSLSNLHELVFLNFKQSIKEHCEKVLNYKIKVYLLNKKKLYSVKNKIKFIVEITPEIFNKAAANDENFEQLKEELIIQMLKEIKKAA